MNTETQVICDWICNHCLQDAPSDFQLSGETQLLEEVGLDSLEIVRLVNFIEDEFNISVDVEELVPENFESVDRVVAMLSRIRAHQPDASTTEDNLCQRSETAVA